MFFLSDLVVKCEYRDVVNSTWDKDNFCRTVLGLSCILGQGQGHRTYKKMVGQGQGQGRILI